MKKLESVTNVMDSFYFCKGGNMLYVIIAIMSFIIGLVAYRFVHLQGFAGYLVIHEEDGQPPLLYLQMNHDDIDLIKKERSVVLKVIRRPRK